MMLYCNYEADKDNEELTNFNIQIRSDDVTRFLKWMDIIQSHESYLKSKNNFDELMREKFKEIRVDCDGI